MKLVLISATIALLIPRCLSAQGQDRGLSHQGHQLAIGGSGAKGENFRKQRNQTRRLPIA